MIYSFEIISEFLPDPKTFLRIAVVVAGAAAVNPSGIKTLLTNDFSTFLIKGKPVFDNDPKILPKIPPDCPILWNWVFDNSILADELFAKALPNLKTCVLVNDNLCRKLVLSLELPATFDERFKVTSVPFFVHIKQWIRQFCI